MTDEQIKHMTQRFLSWELPYDFNPDNGITFDPVCNPGSRYESQRKPVGTNLLNAVQAEAMVRHMVAEMPSAEWEGPLTDEEQAMIDAAWDRHKHD